MNHQELLDSPTPPTPFLDDYFRQLRIVAETIDKTFKECGAIYPLVGCLLQARQDIAMFIVQEIVFVSGSTAIKPTPLDLETSIALMLKHGATTDKDDAARMVGM